MQSLTKKLTRWIGVLLGIAVLSASPLYAQCASGSQAAEGAAGTHERRIMLSPDQVVMLNEIGGILVFENDSLKVLIEPVSASQRMAAYRAVDLRQGDVVMMINGKRFENAEQANAILNSLTVGEEIKLAVRRDDTIRMVSFPKADPDKLEGPQVMVKTASCGPGETMEVIGDLSLMLIGKDNQVRIDEILPSGTSAIPGMTLQKGDIITVCNGTSITSPAQFAELIAGLNVGDQINLTVTRGDETTELVFAKPEATEGARVIKRRVNQ